MNWSAGRRPPAATPRRGGPGRPVAADQVAAAAAGPPCGSPRHETRGSVRSGVLDVQFHGVAIAVCRGQYGS